MENLDKNSIKSQLREWVKTGYIKPDDIPSIELYMDQVTTFMDMHLKKHKRNEEDKTLTKTMINNYAKNNLLPPPEKKKYSEDHIILLIYIYYLKSVLSISDIQTMLKPLVDGYYDNEEAELSLEQIYANLYNLERYQYFNIENSVVRACQLAERDFGDNKDDYLKNLTFLSLLAYDIFTKKKLMEHIIDEMASEMNPENDKADQAEKTAKKDVKKDPKKETKKDPKKDK